MYLPESNLTLEVISNAKQVIEQYTDEELQTQATKLQARLEAIPKEQMRLAQEADDLHTKVRNSALLESLGESDTKKLEMAAELVSQERRQLRVDLERTTITIGLVRHEIHHRAQNLIYRATMHAMGGFKADLAQAIPEATMALAKAISLHCLVTGGLRPESVIVDNFVKTILGDVRAAASAHFAQTKAKATEDFRSIGQWQDRIEQNKKAKAKESSNG